MPAVEVKIGFHSSQSNDAFIEIDFDTSFDMSLFNNSCSSGFKENFDAFKPVFLLMDGKRMAVEYSEVIFGKKPPYSRNSIYSNDVYELSLELEKVLLGLFFNWNNDFLQSRTLINKPKKTFINALDKNIYMSSLYSKKMDDSVKWYNYVGDFISEKHVRLLNESINFIENQFTHFAKIYDLNSVDVTVPSISFWDKYVNGQKDIKEKTYQNQLKVYSLLKQKNEFNTKFNDKAIIEIQAIKGRLQEKILEIKNGISIIEDCITKYESEESVEGFYRKLLEFCELNDMYSFNYNVESRSENTHILVDFQLPSNDEVSNVKGFKSFKDGSLKVESFNQRDYVKFYNEMLYSLTFRLLREIYFVDYKNSLLQVTLNGWVDSINKSNGQRDNKCILSLTVSRDKYEAINFDHIDLRSAFKDLKGISAVNLMDYTPIAPIISINKVDSRFVQSQEVLNKLDSGVNLALIDWEEFEHLIRELFEKEFSVNGGEVKVTQSSRDGGVDAIAFDPDPLRGGKIVIQSKRYTNVVGVSAVRDLYGTVLNEGATKGIIVTTSHYGNDAYEFANGKPLTLLDGNNLLALLQKHGYNARINLGEAKILNSQEKGLK
jgi:restriction system protein